MSDDFNIDTSFLDQEPWTKIQKTREELEQILHDVWDAESIMRPNVKVNDPKRFEKKVMDTFTGQMRADLSNKAQPGAPNCLILGVSMPFDPISAKKRKCLAEYQKDPKAALDTFVKVVRDKTTQKKKVIPIEYKDGDRKGEILSGSGWMFNVAGLWRSPENGAKYKIVSVVVGSSMFDKSADSDRAASLVCPKCGNIDVFKVCAECGTERKSLLMPKLMEAAFQPCSFPANIKTDDSNIEKLYLPTKNLTVDITQSPSEKDANVESILKGLKLLGEHKVTSKNIAAIDKKHGKDRSFWVWMECDISGMNTTPDKKGDRKFYVQDEFLQLIDAEGHVKNGITIKIPENVYEYHVRGKIGVGSTIIIVGKLNSFKGNEGKKIVNLEAWGVYGIPELVNLPAEDDDSVPAGDKGKEVDETSLKGVSLGADEEDEEDDEYTDLSECMTCGKQKLVSPGTGNCKMCDDEVGEEMHKEAVASEGPDDDDEDAEPEESDGDDLLEGAWHE